MLSRVATSITGVGYRYGFNGKEDDFGAKGSLAPSSQDQLDYGNRIYDPRVGRFLSTDPIEKDFSSLSPYQYSADRPIDGIDLDGLEHITSTWKLNYKKGEPVYQKMDVDWTKPLSNENILIIGQKSWNIGTANIFKAAKSYVDNDWPESGHFSDADYDWTVDSYDAYNNLFIASGKVRPNWVQEHKVWQAINESTNILVAASTGPQMMEEEFAFGSSGKSSSTVVSDFDRVYEDVMPSVKSGTEAPITNAQNSKPVQEYEVSTFEDLQNRSVKGDELDLHHLPQKHVAKQVIPEYDPNKGTAIAIDRSVHKNIPKQRGAYNGTARQPLATDAKNAKKAGVPSSAVKQAVEHAKVQHPKAYIKNQGG